MTQTSEQLLSSFGLNGKITEKHAEEIRHQIELALLHERREGWKDGYTESAKAAGVLVK